MPSLTALALIACLPLHTSALYKTVPYPLNDVSNSTSVVYDTTTCEKTGFVCEERPRNVDDREAPTPVYVQIDMIELTAVDEVSGTFVADFLFHVAWRDDRIECSPEVLADTDNLICQEAVNEGMWLRDKHLFFPRMDIMNAVEKAFDEDPVELVVKKQRPGWIQNQTWTAAGPEGPDNTENLKDGIWVLGYCRQRLAISAKMSLKA